MNAPREAGAGAEDDVPGAPVPLGLPIGLGGQTLALDIQAAVITFQPSQGSATNGVIAGVLDTQAFIASLQTVAGSISSSLCSGSAFQSIATQIQQASDIQLSGTAVTNVAGSSCNAISIGLGFDATEIAAPSVIAAPVPPPPNPCGDGG